MMWVVMMSYVFEPISDAEMKTIANGMLEEIKGVCPRLSLPAVGTGERVRLVRTWAWALSSGSVFPRFVYDRAVASYAASASRDDNPPMPGDILRHCKLVMDRAVSDPELRPTVEKWREARRAYRDSALNGG